MIQSYGAFSKVVKAVAWGHDIHNMVKAIDTKTRILFLVNPNNPTGTYINETDFLTLMHTVPSHVLVVVDEAYAEYVSEVDYPNTLKYLPEFPNLIVMRTFSKVYGLAALRLGYSVSSPDISDILNRSRLPFNVNSIAAKAACAALSDQEHVKNSLLLNQQGRLQLEQGLKNLGINFIPSIGNFITLDVNDGMQVYEKLLHEGVIVRPLTAYNMAKHIRVSIGTQQQNERFLQALQKILRG